ncbi:hypothetical protein Tco_0233336 [Tanacetum coccineum]
MNSVPFTYEEIGGGKDYGKCSLGVGGFLSNDSHCSAPHLSLLYCPPVTIPVFFLIKVNYVDGWMGQNADIKNGVLVN